LKITKLATVNNYVSAKLERISMFFCDETASNWVGCYTLWSYDIILAMSKVNF